MNSSGSTIASAIGQFLAERRDGGGQVGFGQVQERRDGHQAGPQRLHRPHHLADHPGGPWIPAAVRESDQRRQVSGIEQG